MNCIQTTFVSSAGYCWPFTKTKWTKLSTTTQKIFIETAMLPPTAFISEFLELKLFMVTYNQTPWQNIVWLQFLEN